MPALANKTYFNYGGQGPLPTPSLEAITKSWQRIQELGPFTTDVWPYISREVNSTRALLAGMCGVAPHRLALSENVTSGCVLPLWGLPLQQGDRLLIGDCEHPGVVAACHELARRLQLEIDTLPVKQIRGGREQQSSNDGRAQRPRAASPPQYPLGGALPPALEHRPTDADCCGC